MATRLRRVLVIDDDAPLRELMEDVLHDEGYEVRTAMHGRAGLAVLAEWRPDVIVLDLMMPVMDGWEFDTVRREAGHGAIPIIVLTAMSDPEREAGGIQSARVCAKPFDLSDLIAAVADLCADGTKTPPPAPLHRS